MDLACHAVIYFLLSLFRAKKYLFLIHAQIKLLFDSILSLMLETSYMGPFYLLYYIRLFYSVAYNMEKYCMSQYCIDRKPYWMRCRRHQVQYDFQYNTDEYNMQHCKIIYLLYSSTY